MPQRRKTSNVADRPPKRRGANRRKAQPDPTSQMYADQEEKQPPIRSKTPRKKSASKRKRSGAARKQRGKKVASAKRQTQRRRA